MFLHHWTAVEEALQTRSIRSSEDDEIMNNVDGKSKCETYSKYRALEICRRKDLFIA